MRVCVCVFGGGGGLLTEMKGGIPHVACLFIAHGAQIRLNTLGFRVTEAVAVRHTVKCYHMFCKRTSGRAAQTSTAVPN